MKKMNRKVKKIKGFTLMELLTTIIILGILSTIGIISVSKIIEKNQKNYYKSQKQMIEIAGKNYFNDNSNELPKKTGGKKIITLEDLISKKYLSNIYDHKKNKCDYKKSYILVNKESNTKYKYYVNLICTNYESKVNIKEGRASITFNKNQEEGKNPIITVNITDPNGLASYDYRIVNEKDSKEVISSRNITNKNIDKTSLVSFDADFNSFNIKSGKFTLTVNAYDKFGERTTKQLVNIIITENKVDKPSPPNVKFFNESNNMSFPPTNNYIRNNETLYDTYTPSKWTNKSVYVYAYSDLDNLHDKNVFYEYVLTGLEYESKTSRKNIDEVKQSLEKTIVKDGKYKIKFRVCNGLNNCSDYTDTYSILIDKTPPTFDYNAYKFNNTICPEFTKFQKEAINYEKYKNGSWSNEALITYPSNLKDSLSGVSKTWYKIKNQTINFEMEQDAEYRCVQDGKWNIKWYAMDKAGNITTISKETNVDTQNPKCNDTESLNWSNASSRQISVKCSSISGCTKDIFTKTFQATSNNKVIDMGSIQIKNNAGTTNNCEVPVKLDIQKPSTPLITKVKCKENCNVKSWNCNSKTETNTSKRVCNLYLIHTNKVNESFVEFNYISSDLLYNGKEYLKTNYSGIKNYQMKFDSDGKNATNSVLNWSNIQQTYCGEDSKHCHEYLSAVDNAGNRSSTLQINYNWSKS